MRMKKECYCNMGRMLRTQSYAMQENQLPCISCTTFNILAPIYKRLNKEVLFFFFLVQNLKFVFFFSYVVFSYVVLVGLKQDESCRESEYRACWLARNQRILDWLLYERSSIICLQVSMFINSWPFSLCLVLINFIKSL